MGFRLAPREVDPLPPQPVVVPRFRPFWVRFSLFGGSVEDDGERVCFRNFNTAFSHTGKVQ